MFKVLLPLHMSGAYSFSLRRLWQYISLTLDEEGIEGYAERTQGLNYTRIHVFFGAYGATGDQCRKLRRVMCSWVETAGMSFSELETHDRFKRLLCIVLFLNALRDIDFCDAEDQLEWEREAPDVIERIVSEWFVRMSLKYLSTS